MSFIWVVSVVLMAPECRVELVVVDAATGESLPRTRVTVEGRRDLISDQDGRVELVAPCGRELAVVIDRADYRSTTRKVTIGSRPTLDVALEPEAVTRVDDVVVRAAIPERHTIRSSTRLDERSLEQTRGNTLADSISEVAGVATLRTGSTSKPVIRGQQGRRVLIVFDGVRHESQKWGLDHGPEVDPFAAGSLEVIKGASSVRYGPDAIGGVILIRPPDWIESGYQGLAHQVLETNGRQGTLALRLNGAPSDVPVQFRIDGNIQRRASFSTPDYPLQNTGGQTWNGGGALRWGDADLSLELSYRHHDFENGIFSGIRSETPENFFEQIDRNRPLGSETFEVTYDYERPFQVAQHDVAIARTRLAREWGKWTLTYAFQLDRRREFDIARRSITGPQADFALRTHTGELVFEHAPIDSTIGRWRGTAGATGWWQGNAYSGLPLIVNYRSWNAAAFLVERLELDDFVFEAGARVDGARRVAFLTENNYVRQLGRGAPVDSNCVERGEDYECPSTFFGSSATLGGTWSISPHFDLSLEFSTATRFPSIDEQYLNGTAPSFPVYAVGDPAAAPETTLGTSLTARVDLPWIVGEVSAFANRIDGYLYFAPEFTENGEPAIDVLINGAFPRFSISQIDALFWGADGAVAIQPFAEPVELELGAALVRAKEKGSGRFLALVPADRLRMAFRYMLADGWRFSESALTFRATWVARQNRSDLSTDFAAAPAGYALLGASAETRVDFGGVPVGIQLEVMNLLNQRYREYTSLLRYFADEPGRSVVVRLSQEF